MGTNKDQKSQETPKQSPAAEQSQSSKPKKQKPPKPESVGFFKLFRFATGWDAFMVIVATFTSLGQGVAQPIAVFIVGDLTDAFGPGKINDSLTDRVQESFLQISLTGIGTLICFMLSYLLFKISSFNQCKKLRAKYLEALLEQEQAWHDTNKMTELSSRAEADCTIIMNALETHISTVLMAASATVSGFVVGFIRGWQLALVCAAFLPLFYFSLSFMMSSIKSQFITKITEYTKIGAIVTQVLGSIKTVVGLGGERREINRYYQNLVEMRKKISKAANKAGLGWAVQFATQIISQGICFYAGARFILDGIENPTTGNPYSAGDFVVIFIAVQTGGMAFSQATPAIAAITNARITSAKIFKIIDRVPAINAKSPEGAKPADFTPLIKFEDVKFDYPSRTEKPVLKGINLEFQPNQRTALVGESGCGKSTCMMLIQRFYDPKEGAITLEGKNIKEYNVSWLRKNIAYVGQEPVLFSATIRQNLKLAKQDATDEQMIKALKRANAYEFIKKMEKGLDTPVGEGGTQLSGGQKQRIAIARAILKEAKILLLDEATSALDRKNELEIQETLDQISANTTTIVIAHRLSTIKNAHKIYIFKDGLVAEEGTHKEMIADEKSLYYALQKGQLTAEDKKEEEEKDADLDEIQIVTKDPTKKSEKEVTDKKETKKQDDQPEFKKSNYKKMLKFTKTFKRVYNQYAKSEKFLIFIAYISSILAGLNSPMHAVIFSNYQYLYLYPDEFDDFEGRAGFLSGMFGVLGAVIFLANWWQKYSFEMIGEDVTRKLRKQVYQKFLTMHMGWHDKTENMSGKLSTALSKDTENLSIVMGNSLGSIFQMFSAMTAGLIIGFITYWKLALVALTVLPFFIIFSKIKATILGKKGIETDGYNNANKIVIESVSQYRTIASLGAQKEFSIMYEREINKIGNFGRKLGTLEGLLTGLQIFLIYFVVGLINVAGASFINNNEMTVLELFLCQWGMIWSTQMVGLTMRFMGDVGKALASADNLFNYIDTPSEIDIFEDEKNPNKIRNVSNIEGHIEFKDVKFKYPSRDAQIFDKLNFEVRPGKKIALVGASGCGKSTIIQLLMRFYDVQEGEILLDGKNIKDYDVGYLRSLFGLVQQEPVLFDGSIEFNIKYAKENASDEEMKRVAELANCRKFIEENDFGDKDEESKKNEMGEGYSRQVGAKGSQMSGGQKQRIAIARAILMNPKIYLFDEATSALDSENETLVQDALNKISVENSTVTVAHRFATIKKSDNILAFQDGKIVEQGTYTELTDKKGFFYHLEKGLDHVKQ